MAGLGLSPREAWASTPRELSLALAWRSRGRSEAPGRGDLEALMARFPD
ncbi:phage tail assembly chaperone [Microbaculum marinum]|uniref:Phage tail assembly chaperone n=1 Tax=Microbaculum marinum TaxID=1764581 RepID=A0AAW9RTS8_9HYPH